MEQYDEYEEYEYSDDDFAEDEVNQNNHDTSNDDKERMVSIISFISTWFIRIGIVIAIVLLLVFFVTGKVLTALFYIIGLVVAFLFGYGFMFLLDHIESSD